MRVLQIKFLFLLAFVAFPMTLSAQKILLVHATNTVWKYHPNTADPGFATPDAWIAPGFDDSSWAAGNGVFGYESSVGIYPADFHTYIAPPNGVAAGSPIFPGQAGSPLSPGPTGAGTGGPSAYFRTHFNWSGGTVGVTFDTTNLVDDGIIVYLNGVEIYAFNVPATRPMTWDVNTLPGGANPAPFAEPSVYPTNSVPATGLVAGDNVLAVELHQQGAGSSDDIFGLWLYGVIPFAPTNQNVLQPTNRVVLQNRSSVLQVFSSASPDAAFQWYVGGVAITDATNSTLLVTNESTLTSVSNFYVIATNPLGSFQSRTAAVTFTADTLPPTLVRAIPNATFTEVRVEFSESVELNTAKDPFNYMISGGIMQTTDGVLSPSGKTVTFTLDNALSPDTVYTLTVASVTDLAGLPVADGSSVQFRSWTPTSVGGWVFEAFNGTPGPTVAGIISNTPITALTSHPTYPDHASEVLLMPGTSTRMLAGYEGAAHEHYGARIRGLFYPPESGNWIFYLSPDDAGQLFLNPTGPDAAGKVKIAEQTGCCNLFNVPGAWTSAPIPLVGGQPYYIEGLYKEHEGGDYMFVATALEGAPIPPGGGDAAGCPTCNDPNVVGSGAMPAGAAGTFAITQPPANTSSAAGSPVTFSVGVNQSLGLPVLYQWQRNGAAIPGANISSYTFTPTQLDSGARFSVAVTNLGGAGVISGPATLSVGPTLFISHSGSTATLTWSDPTFTLQSAPTVTGPWTALAGASGVMVSTASGNRYYRLIQ